MMVYVGRLAGAILAQCDHELFLVGNTKQPCDWRTQGLEPPVEVDAVKRPFIRLTELRSLEIPAPRLAIRVAEQQPAERIADALAKRLLVERNGSVSDRLWRLILAKGGDPESLADEADATWLIEMPLHVWNVVRDTVLRCV